jgi:hypothetical protein
MSTDAAAGRERFVGVLMLDTRFPRLPGDVGHPASWSIPVRFAVVPGASPQRVVREGDPALLPPFVAAARELVAQGAAAITTSCGFLVAFQQALQEALPVPVWTSSLIELPLLPRPGVLTVDADALAAAHLLAAGAAASTPVAGLAPGCTLQRTLLEDLPALDPHVAEADAVEAATRLVQQEPQIETIVLECTNLPPYAAAIERATGVRVRHLLHLVHGHWSG